MKAIKPFLRGGTYQFRKRVPRRYSAVEPMPIIQLALHTDSLSVARQKAPMVWAEMIEGWEAKLVGEDMEGEARLAAARDLAQRRGVRWMHVNDVAGLPLSQLLTRLDMVPDKPKKQDLPIIEAVLGTPAKSSIKVSEALDHFYTIAEERVIGKSKDQLRKHKNPRKRAAANFIAAVGNKELASITAEEMFEFRAWLTARVRKGSVKAASANKDITHLVSVWKAVAQSKGFQLGFSTEGLYLKTDADDDEQRPPFSRGWITSKILADGALGGLNTDARLILLGMINTGYRPSEGAGLTAEEIRLDVDVPHIVIQPNANRALKTPQSRRIIPLTGVSLDAFKEARAGFPRYSDNAATLSGTINKFLRDNALLETADHSLYSFRHALEDRMLEAGIDERVRRDILGHKLNRERYGEGGALAFKRDLLLKVAL